MRSGKTSTLVKPAEDEEWVSDPRSGELPRIHDPILTAEEKAVPEKGCIPKLPGVSPPGETEPA